MPSATELLILYDADCGFCSAAVAFVRRRWAGGSVRYLPLASAEGRDLAARCWAAHVTPDTMLVIDGGACFDRSTAALCIVRRLRWPWRWLVILRVVPANLRDRAYDWIARHRHQLGCSHQHATACHPSHRQNLRLGDRAGIGYH